MISQLAKRLDDPTDELRFTVGRFYPVPNTPNSIASRVSFSIDLRHPDVNELEAKTEIIKSVCVARSNKFSVMISEPIRQDPCEFDSGIIDAIEQSANHLKISGQTLSSGAFHDALFLAQICPTGMIFVPCKEGISHDPAENAKPEHLAAGTRVLAAKIAALALDD